MAVTSAKTRTLVPDCDDPAPTVMAYGMGDTKYSQVEIDVAWYQQAECGDRGGRAKRRRVLPTSEPSQAIKTHPNDESGHLVWREDEDDMAGRRLRMDADAPCDTVMAGGVGDVNTSQYTVDADTEMAQQSGSKPPYRVPLMAEVNALPWNGLTVVSTFSGCGGSCLGFKMAGYRVLWANEFVPAAQETYRANHPTTHLSTDDIRKVTAADIRAVIGDVEIDVLEGSPPCASFSTAGKLHKGWGEVRKYSDTEQRTDDLFDEYIRLVDGLRPRAFVAENVSGMVKGVAKGHFKRYLAKMRALPYNVEAQLLDAQYLGVPQRRVRLIFVGVRKDVGAPLFPTPLPYRYSIREAIPWIASADTRQHGFTGDDAMTSETPAPTVSTSPSKASYDGHRVVVVESAGSNFGALERSIDDAAGTIRADQARGGHEPQVRVVHDARRNDQPAREITDEPCPTITVGSDHIAGGGSRQHFHVEKESALGEAVGRQWDELDPNNMSASAGSPQGSRARAVQRNDQSEKYLNLVRPSVDAPCPTVTQLGGTSAASVTHPTERRKFTIAELRRICAFPDDFVLTGSYAQQWERLGRAVPPLMMRAVAEALVPVLKK